MRSLIVFGIASVINAAACSSLAPFNSRDRDSAPINANAGKNDGMNLHSELRRKRGVESWDEYVSWDSETSITTEELSVSRREFSRNTQLAIWTARGVLGPAGVGFAFWDLADDCTEYHEKGTRKSGAKCIVGSITTVAALISFSAEIRDFYAGLALELKLRVAELAHDFTPVAMAYGLGPYLAPAGNNVKRGLIMERAESVLSSAYRAEVRHIGDWDGNMQGYPEKRGEDVASLPVFGVNVNGRDFHFAHMGFDPAKNASSFRFGTGPGPETENNRRRLKARDDKPRYNTQFFDRGGLDAIGRSDIEGDDSKPGAQPTSDDTNDYNWLYHQVSCYMGGETGHTSQFDSQGLWFQIYDDEAKGTLSAGAIAPFSANKPSIITWMKIEGGLGVNRDCINHDEL
ncbi:hypothetical protein F4818DRAFT_444458 [Hypoxylon cercidicola]|nr:hypothetical protein F4818DRAFT_444458 [Hypoxylon cercidicola]